jgi:hypothetical protein
MSEIIPPEKASKATSGDLQRLLASFSSIPYLMMSNSPLLTLF